MTGRKLTLSVLLAVLALAMSAIVSTARAEPVSAADVAALKKDLADVKRELREIKGLLLRQAGGRRNAAPRTATLLVEDRPGMGDPKAPLTMVEFSDYQCPFCRRFSITTLSRIKKEYVETGKLRYVFRDFPITKIHPLAVGAAIAAQCAGEQGKYWDMHDLLFQKSRELKPAQLKGHARTLGLDDAKFSECTDSKRYLRQISTDVRDGQRAGVRGTPTFFLGPTKDGKTMTGAALRGAQPYAVFKRTLDAALANLDRAKKGAKKGN